MSPSLLKMAQEQSLLSLILGEKEVLVRVTPISSEMEENRFLKTSNIMGLTFTASSLGKFSHHRGTEGTENLFFPDRETCPPRLKPRDAGRVPIGEKNASSLLGVIKPLQCDAISLVFTAPFSYV
jgi:hypothetical protein